MHKIFLIFFVLMFSDFCFSQGDSPALLRGQAQTSNSVGAFIRTPNSQVTRLNSSTALLETGNTNILVNPNFAHSSYLTGWSTTGDTSTKSEETSVVISGTKSAAFIASAQAINLSQSSTLYAAQFADGVQGIAMCRIKSSVALNLCSISAGTVSATNCVAVNPDSKWGLYKVPFILGATSNGVSVASSGNVTGTAYVDDCFVGAVDLKADVPNVIRDTATSTSMTYSAATSGVYKISSTITTTNRGVLSVDNTGSATKFSCLRQCKLDVSWAAVLSGASTNLYLRRNGSSIFQYSDSGSASVWHNISTSVILNTNDYIELGGTSTVSNGELQIVATSYENGSVYTASCGANCVDTFSAAVGTTDVVSGENVDWINGDCTNAGTGLQTCNFNSGIFTQTPVCTVSAGPIGGSFQYANIYSVSSSAITIEIRRTDSSIPISNNSTLSCTKAGADFIATRNIVGSFNEVMTTPGISKPKTCYYAFGGASATLASPTMCVSGTCTEVVDTCGNATPPTFAVTGVYTNFTLANGTFANSSFVDCRCTAWDASTGNARDCIPYWETGDQSWQTTSSGGYVTNLFTSNASGTASNTYVQIKCEGQAP